MSRPARLIVAGLLVGVALLGGGCVAPVLSAAQIDALHTHHYEAPPEEVFSATSNALMDLGYHIGLTDAGGGILAAERRQDPSILEHTAVLALTTLVTLGQAPTLAPPSYYVLCVIVSEDGDPERAVVRFEIYKNSRQVDEQERIEELFLRIERRLLTTGEVWDEPVASSAGRRAPPQHDDHRRGDDDEDAEPGEH